MSAGPAPGAPPPPPSPPLPGTAAGVNQAARELNTELKEVAKKLFVLCLPWPAWRVSGSFIAELPSEADQDQPVPGDITENDVIGDHILLFTPLHLRGPFLSASGQRLVSYFSPHSL